MDSGVSACSPEIIAVEAAPPCSPPQHPTFSDAAKDTHPPHQYSLWTSSAKTATAAAGSSQNPPPPPPPPYTSGPSRVILANDGTKSCLALLLTPELVAALNQISKHSLALNKKDGEIERLERNIKDGVGKMENLTLALGLGDERYEDRKEEMQLALEILQLEQEEKEERKGELVREVEGLENGLRFARFQSEGVIEEALGEADLLELDGMPDGDNGDDDDEDDGSSAADSIDAPSVYSGVAPSPEEQRLRDAQMEVVASFDVLKSCRVRLYDTRRAGYGNEEKIAGGGFGKRCSDDDDEEEEKKAAAEEGDHECGKTEIDHRHLKHVQSLTREIVNAERGYKIAKGRVRDLELALAAAAAAAVEEEEDMCAVPRNVDQKRIEDWRRGVDGEAEGLDDGEFLDLDKWMAGPVDIMDSVSAVDRGEYVDEIEEWKGRCRRVREEVVMGV